MMNAVFNFKVEITDSKSIVTMQVEKVEGLEIAKSIALLKVFSDVNRKVKNVMEKSQEDAVSETPEASDAQEPQEQEAPADNENENEE